MNGSIVFTIFRLDSNFSNMIVISWVGVDNHRHFPLRSSVLVVEFQNQITNFDIFPRSKPFVPWQNVRCEVLDPAVPECVHSILCIGVRDGGAGGAAAPPKRLQSRKVGQMFNISRAKSGKLKSQKAPSLLGKQRQSDNIRFTVGQYWLIIKRTGRNYVNFVVNLVLYGKGV